MRRVTEKLDNIEAAFSLKKEEPATEAEIVSIVTAVMKSPLSSMRERLQAAKMLGEYYGLWQRDIEPDYEDLTPIIELIKTEE